MSLSQIKFIPTTTFPSASRHLQRNTHFLQRGGGNNRIRPAAVLTAVFTKSVWIKEKAVVLAQEQVCTKGRSSTAFLKFLDPVSCTHTCSDARAPTLPSPMTLCAISLYIAWVHSQILGSKFGRFNRQKD